MHVEFWAGCVLRDATVTDLPRLIKLEREIDDLHETQRWSAPRWTAEVMGGNNQGKRKSHVWVVEQGSIIVYAIGFFISGETCDVIKLISSAVGRSFTARVIAAGLPVVREWGVKIIKGRCAESLRDFYIKMGFKVTGEMPNYFGVGVSAWSIERGVD